MLTTLRGVARAGIAFSSLWVDSSWFLRYTHLYSYVGWYVFEGDQGNYKKSLRCMYSETTHWGIHHCHGLLGVCIRVFCRTCLCWYISMVFKHFPTNKFKNKKVRIYKTRALEFYICVLMKRNYFFNIRMWYRPVHYINSPETNCIYVVVLLLIMGSLLFDKWDFRDFQIHI